MASADSDGDWNATDNQVLGRLTLQTAVHYNADLVFDMLRNVELMQIIVMCR